MSAWVLDHLWQSTLFVLAAWLLTLALRNDAARVRYWVWLAASIKFLIPFGWLMQLGTHLGGSAVWVSARVPLPLADTLHWMVQPLAAPSAITVPEASAPLATLILLVVWVVGSIGFLARWQMNRRRVLATLRAASPCHLATPVPVLTSPAFPEPAVFGILKPVLLLPANITARLSSAQLDALIAHELCHVRRRDNLTAAIHMLVEALFWFHPLVWWIGARLVDERERACDETVIELGNDPRVYAEGILSVCRLRFEPGPGVVARASGANLRQRIELIMSHRPAQRLSRPKALLLAALAVALALLPVAAGAVKSVAADLPLLARGTPAELKLAAAVIHRTRAGRGGETRLAVEHGRLSMRNTSLRALIGFAYGVHSSQVIGGPDWLDSRYDIEASAEVAPTARRSGDPEAYLPLVEELFNKHFNLTIRVHAPASWSR